MSGAYAIEIRPQKPVSFAEDFGAPRYTYAAPTEAPEGFGKKAENNTHIWDTLATMAIPGYGHAKIGAELGTSVAQFAKDNPGTADVALGLANPLYGAFRLAQETEKANPGFFDKAMCLTNPAYAMFRGIQSAFSNN